MELGVRTTHHIPSAMQKQLFMYVKASGSLENATGLDEVIGYFGKARVVWICGQPAGAEGASN